MNKKHYFRIVKGACFGLLLSLVGGIHKPLQAAEQLVFKVDSQEFPVKIADLEQLAKTGAVSPELNTYFSFIDLSFSHAPAAEREKYKDLPQKLRDELNRSLNADSNLNSIDTEHEQELLNIFVPNATDAQLSQSLRLMSQSNGTKIIDFLQSFPQPTITSDNFVTGFVNYTSTQIKSKPPINLISNNSFENGFEDWNVSGNITLRPVSNLDGSFLPAFNWGNVVPNASLWQSFNTIPGQSYLLEFGYRRNGIPANQILGIQLEDNSNLNSILDTSIIVNETTWNFFTHRFTANETTTILRFLDHPNNKSYNSDIWIDGISIVETDSPISESQSIPEPSSILGIFALGSLGSILLKRKQQRSENN